MAESRIITSQYVQIDQTPAGVGERIFSRIIDYLIIFAYMYGLYQLIDKTKLYILFNNNDYMVVGIFLFLMPAVFYSFLFETFNRGRSLGKMAFGMRVVMRDGTTPTVGAYLMRWMLLIVDVWMSWIGLLVMLLNGHNQRLGDLAAGTIVIKERDYHRIHVSLDEFNHLSRTYRPVFPQAENLSLEQVNIINEALTRFDDNRPRRLETLATKAKEFLNITSNLDNETFLQTLTRDYQYFALEEI
ncbi:MAG: RDD family protein [Tannerella sp.]|jgi:uncharacterized RDD family membrane protein YckC|nr:RDD family protein [Tannerella sp.]